MNERLEICAIDGTLIDATKVWHQASCWRYVLESAGQYVGDMLWEERSQTSAHLVDIKLEPAFRQKGIGTALIRALLSGLRASGFRELTGIVVAHAGIDKDRLCGWYESLGGVIAREDDPKNRRYAGTLIFSL